MYVSSQEEKISIILDLTWSQPKIGWNRKPRDQNQDIVKLMSKTFVSGIFRWFNLKLAIYAYFALELTYLF